MLNNFTVGDRFELAIEIGISEDSPDLEKFAEYLGNIEDRTEELEDAVWDLERSIENRDEEILELKQEIENLKNTYSVED